MDTEKEWTNAEKLIARVISWGIIISVVVVIVGSAWTALEIFVAPSGSSLSGWFAALGWEMQILIIGGLIVGVVIGIIIFSMFIRKGQRFILNLLFKIEE